MLSINGRIAEHPIDPIFLERWSPRAFTPELIDEGELLTMLEAARWAASSYNAQPWRFLYARRNTPSFDKFLGLLVPANQLWAKNASALGFIISDCNMVVPRDGKTIPSVTHSFDAGTSSGYFTLQASKMGWFTHGMVGFERERATAELAVPSDYRIEAVYAVGRRGDPSSLPQELQSGENPSPRMPLSKLAMEGAFRE